MCSQRLSHPDLNLSAARSEREDALDIRRVSAPTAVLGLLIDDEVLLQRRSSKPVTRRIAARVPTGTVSEFLPATVTDRAPSALRHVSWEPDWRTMLQPDERNARRTSRYFFGT